MGGICTTSVNPLPDYKNVISGTQIPEWVSAAGQQLFEQSAEMAASDFPTYTGPRIATYDGSKLTPEEQQARDILSQGATSYQEYIDASGDMAGQLGQGYDQRSYEQLMGADFDGQSRQDLLGQYSGMSRPDLLGNYQGATRDELLGGQFTMDTAQPFLDIYQGAQDAAVNEITRQTEMANAQNRAAALRSGAFGGSRLGIQEGMTAGEGARAAGDLRSRAAAQGLDFAASQFAQDRAARFQAEDAMRSRFEQDRAARFGAEDVARRQFEQDRAARFGAEDALRSQFEADRAARFGAEDAARAAYETEEAGRLRATESLQSFAPLVQGLQEQAASGLLTAGQAQRQLDQMALDLAYADFVEQREYPFQMLNFIQGQLQGVPYETRTIGLEQGQQYVQSPSVYGQTIGGLGSLASAYYMGRGR